MDTVDKNVKQAKKIGINIDVSDGNNAAAEIFLNENLCKVYYFFL